MANLTEQLTTGKPLQNGFWGELGACDHVLHLYEDEHSFLDSLHHFLWSGFQSNEGVIVIATEAHLAGLDERILRSGVSPDVAKATGRYQAITVDEAMSHFMVNDWPEESLFRMYVGGLLNHARRRRPKVRAFGEMVALLWERGLYAATVRLEYLWHQVCQEKEFSVYCAYPKVGFLTNAHEGLEEICRTHSCVFVG